MRTIRKFQADENGATTVEYALILALVFLAMVSAVQGYGVALGEMWSYVADEVLNA